MKSSSRSDYPVVRVLIIFSLLGAAVAPVAQAQVNFSAPPTYIGAGQLFVADFNGDGKPDILDSDGNLNLGNGDGTFTNGTPVPGKPLAVADFNGDGKPDILEQGTGTLLVLLGNGDGTFQPPISTNIGASLTLLAATDLNGDGKADVAGVSNGSSTLLIYLNNGNGTFAAGVAYNLGTVQGLPQLVVFGDFNGDSKADIAMITAGTPGQVVVLLGNGDGTFLPTPLVSTGVNGAISVVVGDFNRDGKLDLATSTAVDLLATVFLQLGNGDGTFQTATTACTGPFTGFAFEFESIGLAAADLNGDGNLDLVLTADLIGIYLGSGHGTFSSAPNYYEPMNIGAGTIAIADFNLDGKPDVAASGEILLGKGDGTVKGPPTVLLPTSATLAVVGKFVKNAAPGVAAISTGNGTSQNTLYVLVNDGTGFLSLAHTYTLPQPGSAIATGDVNGDGNLDLIVIGSTSTGWSYTVLLGNGDGSFQSPVAHQESGQTPYAPTIVIADFNSDGKQDFAVPIGNSVAVLVGNGDGTFGSPTLFFDGGGYWIVSADFNGDSKLDLAAAGSSGLAILLGNGDGTFQAAAFPYTASGLSSLLTADLNGDGKADLVSAAYRFIQVFLGNGDGTFIVLPPFGVNGGGTGVSPVALADVNGDGKLDLIAYDEIGSSVSNGIFLGNGDGTFDSTEIAIPYSNPSHSIFPGVQTTDMNGDGKPDLVIESPISTVFVLLNSTVSVPGTTFSPTSLTFPPQAVGSKSNPAPVTLTNTGAVALTVASVSFGGTDANEFQQTNNCTTVEPLTNCTINVVFAPTLAGGSNANLVITDNAGTGSQQVAVSGIGSGFAISAPAPSPTSVSAGGSANTTITITSAGGFNQSVMLSCSSITLNGSPATINPPSCKFNPTSLSNASGTSTLTISTVGASSFLIPIGLRSLFYAMWLPMLSLTLIGNGVNWSRKKLLRIALTCVVCLGLIVLPSCGGGGNSNGGGGSGGTPAGTYTISISASAGSMVGKTQVTLIVQ